MAAPRHGVVLTDKGKLTFPAVPHLGELLTEIAYERGLSRAELLRRCVSAMIVEAAPDRLAKLPAKDRVRIEHIASLHESG